MHSFAKARKAVHIFYEERGWRFWRYARSSRMVLDTHLLLMLYFLISNVAGYCKKPCKNGDK